MFSPVGSSPAVDTGRTEEELEGRLDCKTLGEIAWDGAIDCMADVCVDNVRLLKDAWMLDDSGTSEISLDNARVTEDPIETVAVDKATERLPSNDDVLAEGLKEESDGTGMSEMTTAEELAIANVGTENCA